MSKRLVLVTISLLIVSLLSACVSAELYGIAPSPLPDSSPAPTVPIASPAPYSTPAISVSDGGAQLEETYLSFISDNYDKLSAACFGGIAGVGFVDLDLDGRLEMLLFDAGASASMGVQFFDVIDGEVECVSANMLPMSESFGAEHLSGVVVNANYFDDFRLMQSKSSGEQFFQVISFNGAADFSYHEQIRFGSDNGVLTLTSVCYTCESYDLDTGELTSAEYKLFGKRCDESEYLAALEKSSREYTDTELDVQGVFMWEKQEYTADKAGLLAMANAALSLSRT